MTPAFASESLAMRSVAPGGIATRTAAPVPLPHAATMAHIVVATTPRTMRRTRWTRYAPSARETQRMLQQHRGGKRVDIALAAFGRSAHLAHGTKRGGGGVALVHEIHGHAGALRELEGDGARFGGARRLVAVAVERQSHHEPACLQRHGATNDLGDRRPLARSPHDHARGRCDDAGRIADRQADAPLAVVDGEYASAIQFIVPRCGASHLRSEFRSSINHLLEELLVVLRPRHLLDEELH